MAQILMRLARWRVSRFVLGIILARMPFLLPVERLLETETLVAFHHPRPAYRFHVLLLPRTPFAGLLDIPAGDPFPGDLVAAVQVLVTRFDLGRTGYRLIGNGGDYQDVPYLHFHLIADQLPAGKTDPGIPLRA